MIGGERTSTASRFDVVPNKLALQVYLGARALFHLRCEEGAGRHRHRHRHR